MLSELSGLFGLLQAPKDKQSGAEGALGDLLFDDVYKEVTPDSGLETSVEGDPAPPTEDPAATAATVGEEAPEAGQDEDGQSVVAPDKEDLQTGQLVERRFDADGIEAPQELPVDDVDAVAIEKPLTMNGPATAKPGDSPAGRGDPNSVTSLTQPVSVLPQSETARDDMSDPVATVLRTEMPSADVPDRASAPTGANATLSLTASSLAPDVTRQPEIVADRLVMRQVKQKAGAVGALSGAQARARNEAVQSRISAGRGSEGVAPEPPGSMQQSVLRPTNATPGGPSRERIDVEVSGADWAPEASLRKRAAGQPVIAASHKHSQAVKNHEPILAGQISALPGAQVEGSSLMDSSASAVRMQAPLSDVQMAVGQGHPIWRSTLAIQRSAGRDPASPADQSRISPQGEMARSVGDPGNDAPNRPATSTSGMAITAYQVAVQGRPGVTDESVTPTKAETAGQRVPGRSVQRELPMESPPAQAIPSQGGARATTQRIPDKFLDVISKSTDEPDRSAIASQPPFGEGSLSDAPETAELSQVTGEIMRKKPMSIPSEDAVDTGKAGLAIGNPGVASKRNVHAALPEPVSAGASNSGAAVEISLSEVASTLAMKSDKKPMRGALFPDGEAAPQQIVGSPRAERPARSSALFEPAPMIRESATTPIAGSDQMMGIDPIQVSNPTGTAATQAKPDNTLHAPIPRAPSMERSSAMDATNLSEISEAGALARTSPKQSVSSVATKAISAVAMPGKASVPFGETPAMISKSEGDVSIQFTRPAASPGPSRAGGTLSPDEAPVASTAQVPPMFRSSRAVGRREAANISAGNQPSIDQSTAPARGGAIAGQLETSEIAGDVMSPGDTTGVSSGEIRTASTSFHMAAPPAARADHASAVMRQIVDAATTGTPNSDGSIELQLRPDELGHVRFKMMHGEHGMTMHISAERPETLDMLRRNIDQLSRYLDDLGYESTSFTFGDGQAGGNSGGDRAIPVIAQDGPQITDSPETIPPLSIASGGLDLRF